MIFEVLFFVCGIFCLLGSMVGLAIFISFENYAIYKRNGKRFFYSRTDKIYTEQLERRLIDLPLLEANWARAWNPYD